MRIQIIELPSFISKARKFLKDHEKQALLDTLKMYPDKGDVCPGTGGVRKIRIAAGDKGKRGGARVIYYYRVSPGEIYLIALYRKSEKSDLTAEEKKQMNKLTKELDN